jgi:hypothetical protein
MNFAPNTEDFRLDEQLKDGLSELTPKAYMLTAVLYLRPLALPCVMEVPHERQII